eukprot:scaffold49_cov409-Prasinococcus_capsulatus_cf.AAC.45
MQVCASHQLVYDQRYRMLCRYRASYFVMLAINKGRYVHPDCLVQSSEGITVLSLERSALVKNCMPGSKSNFILESTRG